MSITLPIAHRATVSSMDHLRILQYTYLAPNVLLFYDHCLTFATEVEQIWRRKLTLQSFLFLFLRYVSPFQAIFFSLSIFPFVTTFPCTIFIRIPPILAILQNASIGAIMILRTYALYERNKHVAIVLLLLLLVQVAVMGILTSSITFSMGPRGCMAVKGGDFITFFWWSPVVLDTVVFIFTISRLHHFRKLRERVSIFRILLRDGVMYYVIICSLNITNALFFLFAKPDLKPMCVSFGISISAAITSRLVLNLHKHNAQSTIEAERSHATEQDVGVLTTIPPVYITSPEFDMYPLHDFSHRYHDNTSWYTNETSDVDARKDRVDGDDLVARNVTVPQKSTNTATSTIHTPSLFTYNITEWT